MTVKDIFQFLAYNTGITITIYDDKDGEDVTIIGSAHTEIDIADFSDACISEIAPSEFEPFESNINVRLDAECAHTETEGTDSRIFCVFTGKEYKLYRLAFPSDTRHNPAPRFMFTVDSREYTPSEALELAVEKLPDYI